MVGKNGGGAVGRRPLGRKATRIYFLVNSGAFIIGEVTASLFITGINNRNLGT